MEEVVQGVLMHELTINKVDSEAEPDTGKGTVARSAPKGSGGGGAGDRGGEH